MVWWCRVSDVVNQVGLMGCAVWRTRHVYNTHDRLLCPRSICERHLARTCYTWHTWRPCSVHCRGCICRPAGTSGFCGVCTGFVGRLSTLRSCPCPQFVNLSTLQRPTPHLPACPVSPVSLIEILPSPFVGLYQIRRCCRDVLSLVAWTQDQHPPGHVSFAATHASDTPPAARPAPQQAEHGQLR